jgi:adenylate cyclase
MNADREPAGTHVDSPAAVRKERGATFGIKAKLFLAFACMAMLTCSAGAVGWYAFTQIENAVAHITEESIVGMAASLRLAEKSAEISALAPALIASRTEKERIRQQDRLVQRLKELAAATEGLKTVEGAEPRLSDLNELEGKITAELNALSEAVGQRLRLSAQREVTVADVADLHATIQNLLEPMVDDAGFDLVINSEDVTAKNKQEISTLVEGGVGALQVLLTLSAQSDLAAGLLIEGAQVEDAGSIPPMSQRFSAAATAIRKLLDELAPSPEGERLRQACQTLIALGAGAKGMFETRSQELWALPDERSSFQARREGLVVAAGFAHQKLIETLTPMVEEAGSQLVITSQDLASRNTEEITELVKGGARTLQILLTVRSEANLIAGILNEAAGVPDPNLLQPLGERFVAATARVDKLLGQLPASLEGRQHLTESVKALTANRKLFDLRREELRQVASAQASLNINSSLVLNLGAIVSVLVDSAQSKSDAAAARTAAAIRNGQGLLLLITALSVMGAAIITLHYVVPKVVRPIESITGAMSGLAAGDTSINIPGRDRTDEIGQMAEALGVFRDTAIEVQRSNLREIAEGRRRLVLAIESISEAFSMYDREDRLLVCNSKYRTLLYPEEQAAEIAAGMAFEDIIRRAAERGYIKGAEGRVEEFVRERMALHREPRGPHIQQRGDGRWIMVSERKTDDGGTVAVYSDITEMKQRETELAEKSRALEQLSSQLAKYLSPQVYESIFTGKQEVKIASRRKKLTVFFSDLAGFTEITDRLESEDLTRLLNHYLTEMSQIALSHGATIDKYVGDAILIFFGDPESHGVTEDALACVQMAIAMRNRMLELQKVWRASGIEKPLQCRMGINTGYCTVGNFGSEDRMDYTIIGGGVNLASRLEAAARPGEILISYETYAHVRDRIRCEERGPVSVKGIAYPVATYQVVDSYETLTSDRLLIREERPNLRFELDVEAMSAADREDAAALLREALDRLSSCTHDARAAAGVQRAPSPESTSANAGVTPKSEEDV